MATATRLLAATSELLFLSGMAEPMNPGVAIPLPLPLPIALPTMAATRVHHISHGNS